MQDDADSIDRRKWDRRYGEPGYRYGEDPRVFLAEAAPHLPASGRAIDLAMGEGQNAVWLAARGLEVEGIDVSRVAVKKARELARKWGLSIGTACADLHAWDPQEARYDVITCFHYLQRDLAPRIVRALAPGGVLVMELPTVDNLALHEHPSARYLAERNEPLRWFAGALRVVLYREGVVGGNALAQIVATKTPL